MLGFHGQIPLGSLVHRCGSKDKINVQFTNQAGMDFELNKRTPIACCTSYAQNVESQNFRTSTNHMIKKDQDPVKLLRRRLIEELEVDRHCIYVK
jgi:hypothetical protein